MPIGERATISVESRGITLHSCPAHPIYTHAPLNPFSPEQCMRVRSSSFILLSLPFSYTLALFSTRVPARPSNPHLADNSSFARVHQIFHRAPLLVSLAMLPEQSTACDQVFSRLFHRRTRACINRQESNVYRTRASTTAAAAAAFFFSFDTILRSVYTIGRCDSKQS